MPLQSSTFDRNQVTLFLAQDYPYASRCFAEKHANAPERIPALTVSNWFQRYFPSPTGSNLYRQLEATVTQIIEISK